jgi:hypothetical protein
LGEYYESVQTETVVADVTLQYKVSYSLYANRPGNTYKKCRCYHGNEREKKQATVMDIVVSENKIVLQNREKQITYGRCSIAVQKMWNMK